MALVDFYQLAVLYKLRHADAGFLSLRSDSLSGSVTIPPLTPLPSVEPDQVHSPLPPSMQHEFKTPERKRDASRPVPDITPLSRGSSMRQRQEGDTDRVDKYNRGDYENYVREDLKSRVFVDFEVFMKRVLHVPDDWRIQWGPAIKVVKTNADFTSHHKEYCERCEDSLAPERTFYKPLRNTANAVLTALTLFKFDGFSSGIPQRYRVNDPKKLQGGVMNKAGLSPDLVALHEDCRPSKTESLHWANPLHVLEVKPYDNAICDGTKMVRLVVDGTDPISNHALPPKPLRYRTKSSPLPTSTTGSSSTSASSNSKKRPADGSSTADQRTAKKSKTQSLSRQVLDGGASVHIEEDEGHSTPKPEIERQADPALQVCRYLLEMFSVPLLRSHATASLVDRDRLQLYHANRSVILVSSAIDFSGGDGLDKFIATIIAFHCLSFKQNGILDTLAPQNTQLIRDSKIPEDDKVVQKGNKLEFLGKDKFTVDLGNVISRDPATVGRSTVVLEATSDRWRGTELVVKVSWPSSGRVSESRFLDVANDKAEKTSGQWATKHLPRVFYSEDIVFDQDSTDQDSADQDSTDQDSTDQDSTNQDSTLKSVARLFKKAKFANGEYKYEQRVLRVIIQERLYPLKSLTNVKDIGQVFLDVACIHRWLYDEPGILHRDLSFNNIMYRIIKEMNAGGETEDKIYGVLTDYDLSSWTASFRTGYTKTSQQRTGTPPYMAHELLKGTSDIHLYRHDVESLFYIMLLMCGRHKIDEASEETKWSVVMREGKLPYEDWFGERNYARLGKLKNIFFSDMEAIELSPTFEDFRGWLVKLRNSFSTGFTAKQSHDQQQEILLSEGRVEEACDEATPATFDDETLGGHISYSTILQSTRYLAGELKGLAIRYDCLNAPTPTLSTSVGAV